MAKMAIFRHFWPKWPISPKLAKIAKIDKFEDTTIKMVKKEGFVSDRKKLL